MNLLASPTLVFFTKATTSKEIIHARYFTKNKWLFHYPSLTW
jgi:hypothetical protein